MASGFGVNGFIGTFNLPARRSEPDRRGCVSERSDSARTYSITHLIRLLNECKALRRTFDIILVFIGMMDEGEFPECFLQWY